jgi:hypothetical protein
MKSLLDFKSIVEEEKSDYSKFDVLVRAGLANKAQMQRIHRILDKMQDEKPNFNQADRMIIQNLFNKMVDLVSNNKQIFTQTRRAVREETELNEDIIDTSDFKLDKSGRKYKAHRIKFGDTTPKEADSSVELAKEETIQLTESIDPPFVLVLKRKAIRFYPEGTKIALYYNERLKKYFSIPYSKESGLDVPIQAEEAEIKEAVDAISQLQKIKDTHQHGTVNHKDGSASKVDVQTAHAVLTVHKNLSNENKQKFADMVSRSAHHMQKAAEFSWKQMK